MLNKVAPKEKEMDIVTQMVPEFFFATVCELHSVLLPSIDVKQEKFHWIETYISGANN